MLAHQLFAGTPVDALEQTLIFAERRHALLAGNVANLDTPGYRTRDASPAAFEARLREALSARREQTGSLAGLGRAPDNPVSQVKNDFQRMVRHDEGDVVLEEQVLEITKNQHRHNLAIAILTSQFRTLQAAISERA